MKLTKTREELFSILEDFEADQGRLPVRYELRKIISETPFIHEFGSYTNAKSKYREYKGSPAEELPAQPLQVPEATADDPVKEKLIQSLTDKLSVPELKAILQSSGVSAFRPQRYITNTTETGHFKFIATGDSHMGHSEFREDWWEDMVERGIKEKVDWMYHTGDILEGMSNRNGHIYEVSHLGFENQFALAKKMIGSMPFPMKAIIGNHDLWYAGKSDQGINVGMRLQEALNNFIYLGPQEADEIVNGIKIKLWHGLDGASYSYSYRTQKFIEHLSGGDKPHILLAGHSHKSIFYEVRNVQVFETGTTCGQTGFMRGKKLAAHTGYWIVDVWTNEDGLVRIRPEWNPYY